MGTGWIWKRVPEKSPDKKQYHVSQVGFPRGVFKSQSGNLPEWKVEQERNRLTCKDPERNGLTLTCPSHAGGRGRAEELKKQRESWTWAAAEKGACFLRALNPTQTLH